MVHAKDKVVSHFMSLEPYLWEEHVSDVPFGHPATYLQHLSQPDEFLIDA